MILRDRGAEPPLRPSFGSNFQPSLCPANCPVHILIHLVVLKTMPIMVSEQIKSVLARWKRKTHEFVPQPKMKTVLVMQDPVLPSSSFSRPACVASHFNRSQVQISVLQASWRTHPAGQGCLEMRLPANRLASALPSMVRVLALGALCHYLL